MCTADVAQSRFLNSNYPSTRPVRFAMKLPRCNAFHALSSTTTSTNNAASATNHHRGAHKQREEDTTEKATTPRASGRGFVAVVDPSHHAAATTAAGSSIRRCQSANATPRSRHPRSIMAGMKEHSMHKSRSHSQEPTSSNQQQHPRTQELPIPPSQHGKNGSRGGPLSINVEQSDLTKMYDYATWNMYERIVTARRRRLSQIDSQEKRQQQESSRRESEADDAQGSSRSSSDRGDGVDASAAASAGNGNKQLLYKNSSHDESSTAATADETDKSSTASSSWSMTDSPGPFPGGLTSFANNFMADSHPRRGGSCPPPERVGAVNEDDHFIFQLDM